MDEDEPNVGLRLLSLDGGGIKGLSELLILKHLMQKIQLAEGLVDEPLPCQYFDMIGGTNAGGLIALMLGRLCMSATDAEKKYRSLSRRIFSRGKKYFGDGKFKTSVFESEVKEIVKGVSTHDDLRLIDPRWTRNDCKTFVCTRIPANLVVSQPALFRTYQSAVGASPNCTIWEAARATSASPLYFKNIVIDGVPYIDGGLGYNNPTVELIREAQDIFPQRPISCIISIGSGLPRNFTKLNSNPIERILSTESARHVIATATSSESAHEVIAEHFKTRPGSYFRFNVFNLDNTSLVDQDQVTSAYLNSDWVVQNMNKAVEVIIAAKRLDPSSPSYDHTEVHTEA